MLARPLLLLATAGLVLAGLPSPAAAAGLAAAGTGEGSTFSFCNPNVRIALAGANTGLGWTFQFVMQRHPTCITVLVPAVFQGAWDPSTGGCMTGLPPVGGTLCLGGVEGLQGTTTWLLCAQAGPCDELHANFLGTIDLVVA